MDLICFQIYFYFPYDKSKRKQIPKDISSAQLPTKDECNNDDRSEIDLNSQSHLISPEKYYEQPSFQYVNLHIKYADLGMFIEFTLFSV